MDTNVESFSVEGFEHDFSNMLPVLWGVEGRLCEDKDTLFGIASEVVKDGPVPEPFHLIPSLDNTAFDRVKSGGFGSLSGDISDIEVKGFGDFFITEHELLFADILGLSDEGGNVESGLHIAGVSHFSVAGTIVDDYEFSIHLAIDLYAI